MPSSSEDESVVKCPALQVEQVPIVSAPTSEPNCPSPHAVQVLRILRLLGAINGTVHLQNHLAEVPTGQGKSLVRAVTAYAQVAGSAPMWQQVTSGTPLGDVSLKRLLFRTDDATYIDVRNAIASHRGSEGGNDMVTLVLERAVESGTPLAERGAPPPHARGGARRALRLHPMTFSSTWLPQPDTGVQMGASV